MHAKRLSYKKLPQGPERPGIESQKYKTLLDPNLLAFMEDEKRAVLGI